jgi:hypothetical protein
MAEAARSESEPYHRHHAAESVKCGARKPSVCLHASKRRGQIKGSNQDSGGKAGAVFVQSLEGSREGRKGKCSLVANVVKVSVSGARGAPGVNKVKSGGAGVQSHLMV